MSVYDGGKEGKEELDYKYNFVYLRFFWVLIVSSSD